MRSAQPFMRLMKSSSTCCTVLRLNPVNRPLTCCTNLPASNPAWCGCKRGLFEKESPQASLLKSELLLTNFEIRLVFTRLRYPSIAAPYRSKSLNRRCSSPNNSRLRISWNWKRHCISLEPYAASTARGSIWRHSSMCFPELSMVRINNPEQCHHTLINRKLRDAFSWHLA